jgi:hypothetical protein
MKRQQLGGNTFSAREPERGHSARSGWHVASQHGRRSNAGKIEIDIFLG